jgi:hypothetical protein
VQRCEAARQHARVGDREVGDSGAHGFDSRCGRG